MIIDANPATRQRMVIFAPTACLATYSPRSAYPWEAGPSDLPINVFLPSPVWIRSNFGKSIKLKFFGQYPYTSRALLVDRIASRSHT
jgi:hypothetical protein